MSFESAWRAYYPDAEVKRPTESKLKAKRHYDTLAVKHDMRGLVEFIANRDRNGLLFNVLTSYARGLEDVPVVDPTPARRAPPPRPASPPAPKSQQPVPSPSKSHVRFAPAPSIDDETRGLFSLAYEKYPKKSDEPTDFRAYVDKIAVTDRFDFLAASLKYADEKQGEREFVREWPSFCAGGWLKVECRHRRDGALRFAINMYGANPDMVGYSDGSAAEVVKGLGLNVEAVLGLAERYLTGTCTPDDLIFKSEPYRRDFARRAT